MKKLFIIATIVIVAGFLFSTLNSVEKVSEKKAVAYNEMLNW